MNKVLSLVLLIVLASCSILKNDGIKENNEYTTDSGLKYTIYKHHSNALKVDSGDMVSVHYIGSLEDSTIFDSSYDRNQPITFKVGTGRVIKGWDEGLTYLYKGDSAVLVIPSDIAYGARSMGKIPANANLRFIVKIVDVQKPIKPWNVEGKKRIYLEDSLSYVIVEKGEGNGVENGDKISMQYSGYFTDFKKFDSSYDRDNSFDVIIGRHRVIKGWDKGILGMKLGEKRRLYIPYQLAYGEKGHSPIPAKADLIFDVELVKLQKVDYPIFDVLGKDTVVMDNGVKYIIAKKTDGKQVMPHDVVSIEYIGKLTNNEVFDASFDRGDSLTFEVSANKVIKGLDSGMLEMKIGEEYRFIIPYELAYGEEGREPVIPAKSTLIFDVRLCSKEDANISE